ncbi:hypothetical protein QQS21_007363 [Conoideocrella luteorostrata]|uniref:Zn(2)-C6 fungal-type domain-containing protein n=1 Tax=Conoideocrella luteorostrata TaxID=1105319 RepID=A0AAJ0FZI7_9HYPO|nr:hypothetical protein QQS21_007363 [Conoideocrella luteorostrata]
MSRLAANPLVTRRNGKIQACEPCRRRKVACDHGYPICRRCRRRPNGASTCYYEPPDHEAQPADPVAPRWSENIYEASKLDAQSTPASSVLRSNTSRHVAPEDKMWSSPAARAPSGFFGPTSFSAAYLETENALRIRSPPATTAAASSSLPSNFSPPSLAEIQDMTAMDQGASHLTIKVLQAVPTEIPTVTLSRSHINPNDEWMRMIGEKIVLSTWDTFGSYLHNRGNVVALRELGSMICINTRRSLTEDHDDPLAWVESFSGSNLRWEAVGIMFICAAFAEFSASPSTDARSRIAQYTEYCSACITLANMGGSSSSLMLFLLYKRSVLHACMHGETSLPYWKFHAETVAMLTFSGLHDDQPRDSFAAPSEPMISMEARRRVRCQIFIVDKFLATFVGRPPLLTRRFCSMKLPLDLDETALLSDKKTFRGHLQRLDSDGWNVDGKFHSSTLLRIRMMVALIRDEILEIGLAQNESPSIDDIAELKRKEVQMYKNLPAHVPCNPTFEDIRDVDLQLLYPTLLIRLDHLLNIFLLERLFVKHGRSRSDLLRTSFEMVVLALHSWTQKGMWAEMQGECQWLVMGYAAPAGAVLSMELIDPNPVAFATDGDEDTIAGETYSKSSIIQQLSLLMGYLKSSAPSQPKGSVVSDVRDVIKRVLDHVLNQTKQPQSPTVWRENFDFTVNWDNFEQFLPFDTIK